MKRRSFGWAALLLGLPLSSFGVGLGLGAARATPTPNAAQALLGVEMLLPRLATCDPFDRPLSVALSLARPDAEIAVALAGLTELAPRGAPSRSELAGRLATTADAAVTQDLGMGGAGARCRFAAGTPRLGVGLCGLASSVPVTPLLAVARDAAVRLAAGDPDGANAALAALGSEAAAPFAPWRTSLADRRHLDAAAARLQALLRRRPGLTP